jgi:crossover junction endodeoxyribonuclease RuvC
MGKGRPRQEGRLEHLRDEATVLVIGVDPGSRYTGWGIVRKQGSKLERVASGCIHAVKGDPPLSERLVTIYDGLYAVLEEHKPEYGAIEAIFTAQNAMSSLKLGHARGVAILALRLHGVELGEYPPANVKQAVAGNGRATKDTVEFMVRRLLSIRGELEEDESDALAVAICHCNTINFQAKLR